MKATVLLLMASFLLLGCERPAEEEMDPALAIAPAAQVESGAPQAATTAEGKIAEATAAAPAEISAEARVLDWPAGEGQDFTELRPGTNGWTCLPDLPSMAGFQPMCLDEQWMGWLRAYANQAEPEVDAVGFAYMLTAVEAVSNTDPYATGPTADNQWHEYGGHIMVVTPDAEMLAGLPTTPQKGPYVMWSGTPYVHIMIPVAGHPSGS